MSDAGEVLLALYGRIEALDAEAAQELAAAFGLRVQEYVYCEGCELKSHLHTYTQYFYNTQVRTKEESDCQVGLALCFARTEASCGSFLLLHLALHT